MSLLIAAFASFIAYLSIAVNHQTSKWRKKLLSELGPQSQDLFAAYVTRANAKYWRKKPDHDPSVLKYAVKLLRKDKSDPNTEIYRRLNGVQTYKPSLVHGVPSPPPTQVVNEGLAPANILEDFKIDKTLLETFGIVVATIIGVTIIFGIVTMIWPELGEPKPEPKPKLVSDQNHAFTPRKTEIAPTLPIIEKEGDKNMKVGKTHTEISFQ